MSLKKNEQIDHTMKVKAGVHKDAKKKRNRWLRRTPKEKIPELKRYQGWEL